MHGHVDETHQFLLKFTERTFTRNLLLFVSSRSRHFSVLFLLFSLCSDLEVVRQMSLKYNAQKSGKIDAVSKFAFSSWNKRKWEKEKIVIINLGEKIKLETQGNLRFLEILPLILCLGRAVCAKEWPDFCSNVEIHQWRLKSFFPVFLLAVFTQKSLYHWLQLLTCDNGSILVSFYCHRQWIGW